MNENKANSIQETPKAQKKRIKKNLFSLISVIDVTTS